jgi:hypothetical protein
VLNALANDVVKTWVLMTTVMVSIIAVSTAYSLIRFRNHWHPTQLTFFLVVLAVDLAGSAVGFRQVIQLYSQSAALIKVFDKNKRKREQEIEFRFWKSCRPTAVWLGNFFTFSSQDFLLQIGRNILESVINLLLAF